MLNVGYQLISPIADTVCVERCFVHRRQRSLSQAVPLLISIFVFPFCHAPVLCLPAKRSKKLFQRGQFETLSLLADENTLVITRATRVMTLEQV